MRRSLLIGALLAVGGVTAAVAAPHTQSANRAAAGREASALLARLVLPPGATPSPGEPSGDGGLLAKPAMATGWRKVADRHAWWTVPGDPAAVLAFIDRHPPAGSRWSGSVSGGASGTPTLQAVTFAWPTKGAELGQRQLAVGVVALSGGRTGVRADAQVQWIVPRPAAERIPAAARVLDVTVASPGAAPLLARTFTGRRRVAGVARLLDRQPILQPGNGYNCPAISTAQPVVTFAFRARPGGAVVARATVDAVASGPSTPCDAIALTIRGRREPALLGGPAVVRGAQRLLGVRLAHTA